VATIDMTEFAGLVTAPGLLQRDPASCIDVLNWEFPAPGVIRKRRGFLLTGGNAGGCVYKLFTSQLLNDQVLAHVGATGSAGTQLRYGDGVAALTALTVIGGGSLTRAVDITKRGNKMAMAMCQKNHYLTANEGVARLESNLGAVRYAGMPRGQSSGAYQVAVGGTNLAVGFARAYRVTWHRKDSDGVELGGAPTARWVISNRPYTGSYSGAPAGALATFLVPREFGTVNTALTTSYYWRLWGTKTYDEASGQAGNDELYLVSEAYLTAGDIAGGFVTYSDLTPDEFLGSAPTLHTNTYNFPSTEAGALQGVVNEDAPPPVANDVAYWQDCMWFANYEYRPKATLALIANFADNDTVTFGIGATTLVLRAKNTPSLVDDFRIATGSPTSAIDIRLTVASMLELLNLRAVATGLGIAGYPIGTSSTIPGLFMAEGSRPDLGTNQLSVQSSVPTKFQASFGYSLNTNAPTNAAPNGLTFSKPFRADAVPVINQIFAGPGDATILRVMPLRDMLLVFTDYGIYRVTGRTFADFSIEAFDLSYHLMARECVALCDDKLYAWCYEGIVEIDEGGVRVISAPIEPTIENLISLASGVGTPSGSNALALGAQVLDVNAFAVAYRTQHQIRFHFPQANDPTNLRGCAQWLGFDTRTRTWTKGQFSIDTFDGWLDARSCGVARISDDTLFCGNWVKTGADTFLFSERRKYDSSDFNDTPRDGNTTPVASRLRLQYAVPIQEGSVHWQQTVWNWDAGEVSWRPRPTGLTVTYYGDEGLTGSVAVTPAALSSRTEPPLEVRRNQRLSIQLDHEAAEYAGIVGISQAYRPGTRFARKVTP